MGLGRQSPQGDTGRVEALEQRLQRLDLIHRNRLDVGTQLQQVAQGGHRTLVDQRGVLQVLVVAVALHRVLQCTHDVRVVGVIFAAMHELQQTALLYGLARVPGFRCQQRLIGLQITETGALDTAGHPAEAEVDDLIGQAHSLEQLGTTVGSHGGDAHLRQDLQQPLGDALAVALEYLVEVADDLAGADQIGQHLVGQIGVNRRGAEADQHREMMRVAGGGGIHQNVAVATQAAGYQVMVHRTDGQRGMHRQLATGDRTVTEHQQGLAGTYRGLGLLGDGGNRRPQGHALVEIQVDALVGEAGALELHQRPPLGRGDHRAAENGPIGMIRRFLEDIALGTQTGFQGHHHRLAQRVDGRVGHLGKLLAEVVIDRTHPAGQHSHGGIVTHGAHRLLAVLAERAQYLVALLEADLEHLHVFLQRLRRQELVGRIAIIQGALDAQGVLLQPLAIGVARLQAVVHLIGMQHLAGMGVHRQDLAGTDPALADHVLGAVVPYADFRGQGDVAVAGDDVAGRAQAVAV